MSFRKRSEVIGTPSVPGRIPVNTRPINPVPGRGPQGPSAGASGRIPPAGGRIPPSNRTASPQAKEKEDIASIMTNPSVRPSSITSQPTVSTGGSDLDKDFIAPRYTLRYLVSYRRIGIH